MGGWYSTRAANWRWCTEIQCRVYLEGKYLRYTCRIHTHTHRYMRHTNTHTQNCPYMCRKFAMLHQDSKCTQTQCNWVKSTYIDAHIHTNTLINTQIHIQTLQTQIAHTSDNTNILIIFATGTFSGRSFIDFESILHKVIPPMLVQRECQKSYC